MQEEQKDLNKDKKKSEKESKSAIELEKYWQNVKDNPADFPGWTYLLHYVEQENNIEAAREAFKAFFIRYPYCYGYWKKYADMEKSLNTSDASRLVFEEGIKAIPLSVDLWIHYLNFYKTLCKEKEGSYDEVNRLFQQALASAGQEFRSDRLWDLYITWLEENNKLQDVTTTYDLLFTIPTQLYSHHFEKFTEHVKKHTPREILSTEEFLELHKEVMAIAKESLMDEDEDEKAVDEDKTESAAETLPPGVESLDDGPPGLESPSKITSAMISPKELELMKEKITSKRKAVYEKNETEVGKRWTFEEGIKRPYFHVKALERVQLQNWKDYLDFEILNGTHDRVLILFERCVIACALYEDMWLKYAKYMEEKDFEYTANIYQRACTIHLPKKPNIHYAWSAYEETKGNVAKACEILTNLGKELPDLLEVKTRLINIERRNDNYAKVRELYTRYISEAKDKVVASFFTSKFSRYLYKVENDFEKAQEVVKEALIQDPLNPKLYMQLVDIGFQCSPKPNIELICEAFDSALSSDFSDEQKLVFSQRKLEFLEDFGIDAKINQTAYNNHVKRVKSVYASRKRSAEESEESDKAKKAKTEVNGVTTAITAANVVATVPTAATTVAQDTSYQYQHTPWVGYQQNSYNYQHSWAPYPSSYYSSH